MKYVILQKSDSLCAHQNKLLMEFFCLFCVDYLQLMIVQMEKCLNLTKKSQKLNVKKCNHELFI